MPKLDGLVNKEYFREMAIKAAGEGDEPGNGGAKAETDSVIDRAIAFFSYYALVFTASCVFIPAPTSSALAQVTKVAKAPFALVMPAPDKVDQEQYNWRLRGSIT